MNCPVGSPSTCNYVHACPPLFLSLYPTAASNYTCYALCPDPKASAAATRARDAIFCSERHPVSDFLISALRRRRPWNGRRNGHFDDGLQCQEVAVAKNHSIDITLLWHRLNNPLGWLAVAVPPVLPFKEAFTHCIFRINKFI